MRAVPCATVGHWVGVHLINHRTMTNREVIECIGLADELGYAGVTLNEDVGQDSFAVLAVAADRTRRISLGTAITNVYVRTAMQIAMGMVTLDDLSGGRALIGLSVGHHPWNDLMHGIPIDAPLARLREYVEFIRKAATGAPFTHEGTLFRGIRGRLDQQPVRSAMPIQICGEGPRMLALAGGVSDGVIMNVLVPDYIRNVAIEQIQSGAVRAGRDPRAVEITSVVTCCVGDDPDETLGRARRAFVERLGGSAVHIRRGRSAAELEEIDFLKRLVDAGQTEQAIEAANPDLVGRLIATGSPNEVWRLVQEHYAAGCTRVLLAPYPRTGEVIQRSMRAMAGHLAVAAA